MFSFSIFALVLSLTFQGFGGNSSADYELFGRDSISSVPQLIANTIQSQDGKNSTKVKLITQDKFNFVSSHYSDFKSPQSFVHYLPIYRLNRKKEYFLLI